MGSVWGFVAPNILVFFIIAFFVKKIKTPPAITQPELLELRYGRFLRLPAILLRWGQLFLSECLSQPSGFRWD
jgi:SSS family solute:Na+ symporter